MKPSRPASFSHLDAKGQARMVNVGAKPDQRRRAVAEGFIAMRPATVAKLKAQALPKGDVLAVARVAGIQAAKRTSEWIPLCHALPLHEVAIDFRITGRGVRIIASAETTGKTGVEMEALVAVSAAALTLYDMCKAVDKTMEIGKIAVVEKRKD